MSSPEAKKDNQCVHTPRGANWVGPEVMQMLEEMQATDQAATDAAGLSPVLDQWHGDDEVVKFEHMLPPGQRLISEDCLVPVEEHEKAIRAARAKTLRSFEGEVLKTFIRTRP